MAAQFIDQGLPVEEARKRLFEHTTQQQTDTTIVSHVAPVPTNNSPLTDDAQKRRQ